MICVVSSLQATHVDRAIPEVLRILKLGVILVFLRFHMRRNEWLICAAALGVSVFGQSAPYTQSKYESPEWHAIAPQ